MYPNLKIMQIILTFLLIPGTMFQDTPENTTVMNSCSGRDPLISISVVLWLGFIASVFFLYLYWRHIHLKASVHNSEMEENICSEKPTDHTFKKELDQSETDTYESLKKARHEDIYESLDTKQEEPISINEDSTCAKDI